MVEEGRGPRDHKSDSYLLRVTERVDLDRYCFEPTASLSSGGERGPTPESPVVRDPGLGVVNRKVDSEGHTVEPVQGEGSLRSEEESRELPVP